MKLWKQVEKSDPASVKAVTLGRTFNAINAQHQIMKATETFGPFGKGWGVSNEEFSILAPGLLLYKAEMWWKEDGEGEANVFGISASIATHMGKTNPKLDDECVKKVATDALTKGLSKLGFNADVFLGLWDDNRYVAQVKEEAEKKTQESRVAELSAKMNKVLEAVPALVEQGDVDALRKIWNDNKNLQNLKGFEKALTEASKDAKKNQPKPETDGEAKDGSAEG